MSISSDIGEAASSTASDLLVPSESSLISNNVSERLNNWYNEGFNKFDISSAQQERIDSSDVIFKF